MKKLLLVAALALLAVGCASANRYSSMGYMLTDDGLPGCAFRYGYYPYYDSAGSSSVARMDIDRVERLRFPRPIDRNDRSWSDRWNGAGQPPPNVGSSDNAGSMVVDRAPVMTAPAPAPPRVVGPRS